MKRKIIAVNKEAARDHCNCSVYPLPLSLHLFMTMRYAAPITKRICNNDTKERFFTPPKNMAAKGFP